MELCTIKAHNAENNRPVLTVMELRHLRYFVATAEELHFARAAQRLNISPSTLSHQIRALESFLGAQLFVRKTKTSVALTHTGKRFLDEARATIRQAEKAALIGKRAARGDIGTIAIGYLLSASYVGLLPASILDFRTANPSVTFHLRRIETFPQMRALAEGEIDVGFARAPIHYPDGLSGFVIDRQPFYLALPEGHPLTKRKQITLPSLVGEDFVTASLEMEIDFRGNMDAITLPGKPLHIAASAPDTFSVLNLVAAGYGLCVIAEPMTQVTIPGIAYRKIVGARRQAEIAVVFRKNEGAAVVKAFIQMLRTKARALAA